MDALNDADNEAQLLNAATNFWAAAAANWMQQQSDNVATCFAGQLIIFLVCLATVSSMSWLFPTNLRCLPTVGLNKSLISLGERFEECILCRGRVVGPLWFCGCWHTFRRVVRVDGEPAPSMIHKINEAQLCALNVNRTVWRSLDSSNYWQCLHKTTPRLLLQLQLRPRI